jgi:hypothetical protein
MDPPPYCYLKSTYQKSFLIYSVRQWLDLVARSANKKKNKACQSVILQKYELCFAARTGKEENDITITTTTTTQVWLP